MEFTNKILLWSFLSVLLLSCGEVTKTEELQGHSIQINLDKAQTLKVSDHFKLKDVIYFSDSVVVDNLMKVSVYNEFVIMHCGWGLDYIVIKNTETGKETIISGKGDGPNQYQRLSNFFINPEGQIELLDGNSGKILTYNMQAELLSVYQNQQLQGATDLMTINGEDYFLYGGNFYASKQGFELVSWNKVNNQLLNSYFPLDEHTSAFMNFIEPRNFSTKPATFSQFYNPFVYYLDDKSLTDSLYFDFGQYNLPKEQLEKYFQDVREFSEAMTKSGYAYALGSFIVNEDFIFASVKKDQKDFHLYIDPKTKKAKVFDKISNDIFGLKTDEKIGYQHRPIAVDGSDTYFILSLEVQHENLDEELLSNSSISELNQTLLSKIQKFEEGDNLAIVMCEIKEF